MKLKVLRQDLLEHGMNEKLEGMFAFNIDDEPITIRVNSGFLGSVSAVFIDLPFTREIQVNDKVWEALERDFKRMKESNSKIGIMELVLNTNCMCGLISNKDDVKYIDYHVILACCKNLLAAIVPILKKYDLHK